MKSLLTRHAQVHAFAFIGLPQQARKISSAQVSSPDAEQTDFTAMPHGQECAKDQPNEQVSCVRYLEAKE